MSEHDFVPIRGRRHLDGATGRPRRRRSRFDDDETPSRRAAAAPADDDAPPSGQRWSTWDTGERGPAPHPPWLVTELAAVDTDLGVLVKFRTSCGLLCGLRERVEQWVDDFLREPFAG